MATPTPEEEIKTLKAKIELQLKSNTLTVAQVANLTSAYNAISGTNGELEKYRSLLRDSQLIIDDIADGLDYMTKSFLDDISHLTKGKSLLNDHKSAISKLANIAKETLDIRLGEQAIDEKRFKKLQETARKQINNLKSVKDQYIIEGKSTDEIDAQIKATIELKNGFSKVSKVNEAINKKLGAAPKLVAGIDKAFQKLGLPDLGFSSALDETKQLGQEAAAAGDEAFNKFSPMKTLTEKVLDNFTGLFTKANLIQGSIALIIDTFKSVDSAIGNLAKGLDMSYNSAANLRMELTDIANFSGDAAVNTKGLQESLIAVSQTLGVNARLSSEDLVTFTKLREQAGYTNDELTSMQRITTITGGSLEKNSKTFLGTIGKLNAQNKLAINAKQLFKDIANVSDAIKLSVGGTAEKIATAAFKAKQFGINLQQADGIASSLLDFESSIANELSAELITGKDLNLEKARLLAINGDIAGASAEILKQVGGTAEFTKMNRIQQEALAKSVGMTREDLAKSLVDREASAKLGAKEGQSAQDRYNELVKSYGVEKASAMLGDEALARQFQQQSVQERFAQSIEKLKEIFVSLVEPLMPVFDVFADIMGVVGPIVGVLGTIVKYTIQFGKYLLIPLGIMKSFQLVMTGIAATQAFINSLTVKDNALKATGNVLLGIGNFLTAGIFSTKTKQGVLEVLSNNNLYTGNLLQGLRNAMVNQSLGVQVRIYAMYLKEKAIEAFKTGQMIVQRGAALGYNAILSARQAILSGELAKSIGIAASYAIANPLMALVGLAVAAGVGALVYSQMKDGKIDPRKGPIISGGFGSVQLDPKDKAMYGADGTIKVGTNLGGGKGNSQQSAYIDPYLLREIRAMRQEQKRDNYVTIENSMNGTKFGTALHMNTYRIQ